jgi:glutamyl-tRNA synthetase
VGNIRTALFDWLFARHHGGTFIVRIEDTDKKREVAGTEAQILDALRWLGIDWDEGPDIGGPHGPYRQSERLPLYDAAAERLLASGDAYRCTCTSERLKSMREAQQKAKRPPRYDSRCRTLETEQIDQEIAERGPTADDRGYVVRFRMPTEGTTEVPDALRGVVSFENRLIDDHVLQKADGFPTYHLASVVDDDAMEITHVFRGEEWLPSAPRHVQLYRALDFEPPVFVHQPLILGPDKGKLSKRHGATSVRAYAEQGYVPDAMVNFLALLGWSKDDHTVKMSREEIVEAFDIPSMGKVAATFDQDRLMSMNAEFIRDMEPAAFMEMIQPWLDKPAAEGGMPDSVSRPVEVSRLLPIATEIQERVKLLSEVVELVDFIFVAEPLTYDNKELMGRGFRDDPAGAMAALDAARGALAELVSVYGEGWNRTVIERTLRELAEKLELKTGAFLTPVRVALSAKKVTPPLFETIEVLGPSVTDARLNAAARSLARPDD